MKKTRIGLLVAALVVAPTTLWAQEDAAEEGAAEEGAAEEGAEADAVDEAALGDELPEEDDDDGLKAICEIDPAACPSLDMDKEAARQLPEEIYAVQQRFIIKNGRFELQPYWSTTLNDQFVGHPGPGLGLNYYVSEVLAIGINGNFYRLSNLDSSFNFQVRRSTRVAVPLTEYDWGAAVNFTYVPADGKFAGFSDFIFHYDAYVVGGVGALSTRPIPVMDPDNRNFDFEPRLAFNAGLGLRIFFNRWFAAVIEVRDYIFNDQLENLELGTTQAELIDKRTWLGDTRLTNNVQLQTGVSVFLPFSYEYRLPK